MSYQFKPAGPEFRASFGRPGALAVRTSIDLKMVSAIREVINERLAELSTNSWWLPKSLLQLLLG
jgi:hypothetical protein